MATCESTVSVTCRSESSPIFWNVFTKGLHAVKSIRHRETNFIQAQLRHRAVVFIGRVKFLSVLNQIQASSKVPRPIKTQEQLAQNVGFGRVLFRRFSFEEYQSAFKLGKTKLAGSTGYRSR